MPRRAPQDPGERNRAVTIQQLTESIGGSGFPVETWSTLVSPYWCSKEDADGRERFVAQQLSAPFETRWVGGYRPDLDPELVDVPKKRRLVYRGRVHDIVAAALVSHGDHVQAGVAFETIAGGLLT